MPPVLSQCQDISFIRNSIAWASVMLVLVGVSACLRSDLHVNQSVGGELETKIYVIGHGWHTGIIVTGAQLGPLAFLKEHLPDRPYYEFDWGDRAFFQATDFRLSLALRAALWPTDSVMHVVPIPMAPQLYFPRSQIVVLTITQADRQRLLKAIDASFQFEGSRQPMVVGKGGPPGSRFFKATGTYHIGYTCNTWTAQLLQEAGIDIRAVATLTADGVIEQAAEHAVATYNFH